MNLHLCPGHGRAFRYGSYVGFARQPIAELSTVIGDSRQDYHEVFRCLAEFVVNHGFEVQPFTVVSVAEDQFAAFAFGDIQIRATDGSSIVDASQSSSWCEIDMPPLASDGFSVGWGPDEFGSYDDCILEAGMVPAGGFWFGSAVGPTPAPSHHSNDGLIIPPVINQVAQSTELKAYPPPRHPSAPARAVRSAQINVPVSAATRSTLRPPSLATPDIDLAEPDQSPNESPAFIGELCFDDGQIVPVTSSIYVGRFPARSGLPDGCQPVVVRGEHVSRVHWGLIVDEQHRCIVKDLGSTGGTYVDDVQFQSQIPLRSGDEYLITANTTVRFGDRWARFEAARPTTKDHALRILEQSGALSV